MINRWRANFAPPKKEPRSCGALFWGGVGQFRKKFPKTKIIGIDDFSTGRKDALDLSVIFYEGSILDEQLLKNFFSEHKPEYVFHFAALPRVSFSVERPRHTSEVFNVAYGSQTTINEVKKLIEKYTGKKLNLEKRPSRLGDARHTRADVSKARKLLGYNPQIDFEEGLKRIIEWFKSLKV